MLHPIQYQHRVPQVYLRKFGFRGIDGIWYLNVFYRNQNKNSHERIDRFTAEINIFDINLIEPQLRRSFELTCKRIEDNYNKIINTLQHQHRLIKKHKLILCLLVSSLLCRSKRFRSFCKQLLKNPDTRYLLVNEITEFDRKMLDYFDLVFWHEINLEDQLHLVMLQIADYFSKALSTFECIVLRAPHVKSYQWITSDDPVVFDTRQEYSLLPFETEIYLPLSEDFCLFMFHPESENKTNPLCFLEPNRVYPANLVTHRFINWQITRNANTCLIMPSWVVENPPHT